MHNTVCITDSNMKEEMQFEGVNFKISKTNKYENILSWLDSLQHFMLLFSWFVKNIWQIKDKFQGRHELSEPGLHQEA